MPAFCQRDSFPVKRAIGENIYKRAVLTLELCANAIIHRFEDFQQHRVRSDGICQSRAEKNKLLFGAA